ncbi:uncharacterized protein LY79DRAFT_260810 [Colletotrichum navitas]|uniref:Uncharacterized protein n=1 Tax=Colletotrichum navitas TaxID=681940 RepID=A0AAD8V4J6_9PEZI|nr:uncharacterized protein LY79DRAFT_260810 [Colletotrichum navitas]KAK1585804.1 hypothetical protein LY79DRAFT_260810 [Colletotrichum navitas]
MPRRKEDARDQDEADSHVLMIPASGGKLTGFDHTMYYDVVCLSHCFGEGDGSGVREHMAANIIICHTKNDAVSGRAATNALYRTYIGHNIIAETSHPCKLHVYVRPNNPDGGTAQANPWALPSVPKTTPQHMQFESLTATSHGGGFQCWLERHGTSGTPDAYLHTDAGPQRQGDIQPPARRESTGPATLGGGGAEARGLTLYWHPPYCPVFCCLIMNPSMDLGPAMDYIKSWRRASTHFFLRGYSVSLDAPWQ